MLLIKIGPQVMRAEVFASRKQVSEGGGSRGFIFFAQAKWMVEPA